MRDFLTVEDVNTVLCCNQGFYMHKFDFTLLPDGEFDDIKYDFCKISKELNLRQDGYIYTIELVTSNWTKALYARYSDGSFIVPDDLENFSYDDGVLTITVLIDKDITELGLYMGLFSFNELKQLAYLEIPSVLELNLEQLDVRQRFDTYCLEEEEICSYDYVSVELGWNVVNDNYILVKVIKTDFEFSCNQSLVVGKVNKVYLGTDSKYKPSGSRVGSYTPTITVTYNGETLPVSYDGTDYYFNLDLTDKTETGKVRFTVNVEANEVLNQTSTEIVLTSQYQTVNTFSALLSALSISDIVRLGSNLTATANIPITRSVKIIGNDKTLNLDSHRFILDEDVQFTIENLQLHNGDTTIIQAPNTKVELTNVTFQNCTSTNYNGLGSCIFCDSEAENINLDDDFTTTLTDCTFTNNHNAILHGGQLNINRCKFHNTDTTYVDIYNSAFIYQTDGDCIILNSVFDIDYGTDYSLCTGEHSIGFSQCIFMCGITATINNIPYDELKNNNFNGFFDNPQNNRSHIFAKYYYPQINACVYTSPTLHFEDKALCYCLSGDDWVYKINSQVTRASWNTENTNRKISW